MRTLHLAYSDGLGGASRASHRIHRAMAEAGMESRMLVRRKVTDDPAVIESGGNVHRLRERADTALAQRRGRDRSMNLLPTAWRHHEQVDWADVIEIQWHGRGTMSTGDVARIRKPVVLSLHDMWAVTATEHYSPDGPEAWWRSDAPPGSRHLPLLDGIAWNMKRRWPTCPVVCPSHWLADCVKSSELLGGSPVHVIPYPLDLDVFRPVEQGAARKLLGLPSEQPIVLFGADGATIAPRKGLDLVGAAMPEIGRQRAVAFVAFGASHGEAIGIGGVRWLGRLHDDLTLALAYSAADVMVVPSRQDNLPQTALEAQACGTPVVAFDVGGLSDAVDDGVTGILVSPFDVAALAREVGSLLDDPDRIERMGAAARKRATRLWNPNLIAGEHAQVLQQARGAAGGPA